MNLAVQGKVALITGSSRGLGRATAQAFGIEGARVVVNYNRSREKADTLVAEIGAAGGEALAIQADVSDRASMESLVSEVVGHWGGVDILVNNAVAFAGSESTIEETSLDQLQRLLDVTLLGAFNATSLCVPLMRERGWGRIVNIASKVAMTGRAKMAAYAAAKTGIIGLTRSLAKELGPHGILVNAVAPQLIMTETMKESMPEEVQQRLAKRNPMRRLSGPEDIVPAVLFLASGWNTFINGQVVAVDGGA